MRHVHRVILDTDIGTDVDDAMALSQLLGRADAEIVGVTTVYGDTALRAQLAARIIGLTGRVVPVYAGRRETLSGREVWWAGHEGALYDDLDREAVDPLDAVDFLVRQVVEHPGEIDVVAVGPLTNIAAAIEADPSFAGAVRHLWIMGGTFQGEGTEHNFRSDAAAARAVFSAGIPTTVTGLDVTGRVEIRRDQVDRIGATGDLGSLIVAEVEQWWRFWNVEWNVPHDPVTVLTLVEPQLFELSEPGHIEIEQDGESAGRSRFVPGGGRTRVVRAMDVHAVADRMVADIIDACRRTPDAPPSPAWRPSMTAGAGENPLADG